MDRPHEPGCDGNPIARRRLVFGPLFELLPYVPLAALIGAAITWESGRESRWAEWIVYGNVAGLFVTGLGWLFLGRFTGAVLWLAVRGGLVLLALFTVLTHETDPRCVGHQCDEWLSYPLTVLVLWLVAPVGSALTLVWSEMNKRPLARAS